MMIGSRFFFLSPRPQIIWISYSSPELWVEDSEVALRTAEGDHVCIPSCGDNSSTFSEQIRNFSDTVRKYLICSLKMDELSQHEGISTNKYYTVHSRSGPILFLEVFVRIFIYRRMHSMYSMYNMYIHIQRLGFFIISSFIEMAP
jgi:hypothetical protein